MVDWDAVFLALCHLNSLSGAVEEITVDAEKNMFSFSTLMNYMQQRKYQALYYARE